MGVLPEPSTGQARSRQDATHHCAARPGHDGEVTPAAETRSARPCRPAPRGSAPPGPRSLTTTRSVSASRATSRRTSAPGACLVALVMPSVATYHPVVAVEAPTSPRARVISTRTPRER